MEEIQRLSSPSGVLKRKRNPEKWQINIAKRQRNLGQEYVSSNTGQRVAARAVGPPCTCQKKCFDNIGIDAIKEIHSQYWSSGDWAIHTSFIQSHSRRTEVKRRRGQDPEKQRAGNWIYHVSVGGEEIVVCRVAFASILCVEVSAINRANAQVTSAGVLLPDGRGKHDSHNRIPGEKQQLVIDHVKGIPKVKSHYSRRSSPHASYLQDSISSMSDLYDIYIQWLRDNNKVHQKVTKHYYEDCVHDKFPTLKLSKPKSDTCKICDIFNVQIKEPLLTEDRKKELTLNHNLHLIRAKQGQDLAKKWEMQAGDDTWIIVIDLQAALPTPKVSSNFAFYKRKLYTLNFGIHDLKTGRGYMYLWDEVTARRGAIEICSCIYKFVTTQVPDTVKKLIIISDNCPGQNKNYFIVMFYLFLIHSGRFEEIIHLFLRPGHTYNAADRDFGTIERNLRTQQWIMDIYDYMSLIRSARTRKPFVVTKMEQSDFIDFPQLKIMCTKRATPQGVRFSDACWFRFSNTFKEGYELATSYAELSMNSGGGYKVNIAPRGARATMGFNLARMDIRSRCAYDAPLKLTPAKLKDLRCIIDQCAGPIAKERYWNRVLGQPAGETPPDMDEYDENDVASFCDIFDYE